MDQCIDSLRYAKVLTTLDAYYGYWKLSIKSEDKHKTTFTCHAGTLQCIQMQVGLTNATGTFQQSLNFILSSLN